jgi:hypothetical protein
MQVPHGQHRWSQAKTGSIQNCCARPSTNTLRTATHMRVLIRSQTCLSGGCCHVHGDVNGNDQGRHHHNACAPKLVHLHAYRAKGRDMNAQEPFLGMHQLPRVNIFKPSASHSNIRHDASSIRLLKLVLFSFSHLGVACISGQKK